MFWGGIARTFVARYTSSFFNQGTFSFWIKPLHMVWCVCLPICFAIGFFSMEKHFGPDA